METEVNFIAENVDIEQFPDVLFALICVESLFSGESLPNVGELFLNSFGLRLLIFAGSNVGDELVESSHIGASCDSEHLKYESIK